MDHSDHTHLHMTCDAEKDVYQNQMDKLYATINNDLVLSLQSVDALYEHLEYFFEKYEELPANVKIELWKKWKQIAMYHLNQWPQITNTDGDGYRKLHRTHIEQWWDILTKNDIDFIISQDKSIVKDLMLHIFRRLKKHGLTEELLYSQPKHTTGQYIIPLRIRWRSDDTNQVLIKDKTYESLMRDIKMKWGINLRGVRDQTNGKYILWSEEWKRRFDVQHKYLVKLKEVIDDNHGDKMWDMIFKKLNKQLFTTIEQWNNIQVKLWDEEFYRQKSRSFYGMHEEMTKVAWRMWDRLKKLLLDEYCFI